MLLAGEYIIGATVSVPPFIILVARAKNDAGERPGLSVFGVVKRRAPTVAPQRIRAVRRDSVENAFAAETSIFRRENDIAPSPTTRPANIVHGCSSGRIELPLQLPSRFQVTLPILTYREWFPPNPA